MRIEVPTLAELKEKNKKAEIVFWVGCAGSFDERAKKITKAFAKILVDSKISFGCSRVGGNLHWRSSKKVR